MKRILYIILVVLAVIPAACKKQIAPEPEPEPIGREEFPGNVIYYTTVDDQPILLPDIKAFSSDYVATYYQDGQGVFLFADNVETINAGAFNKNDKLKSISLSPYIKTIGDDAFSDCVNLESVSFSRWANLNLIGKNAFKGCKNLTSLTVECSVNEIGDYAFSESSVESFKFPSKVTKMGTGVMKDCKSLTTVVFDDTDTVIGDYCFDGCEKLSSVTFPTKGTALGSYAFKGCNNLRILHANFEEIPSLGENTFAQDSLFFIKASWDELGEYRSKWSECADHIMLREEDREKVDIANWTDYMPDCIPLSMMTIPAAHDAATYIADIHTIQASVVKDQNVDYAESWNWGTRMLDLRMGHTNNNAYFVHAYFSVFSTMNTISGDFYGHHFPTKDQIKNSFLIMELQIDMPKDPDQEDADFLMAQFISHAEHQYDRENFVLYHPDMTLGEARGKIILTVTDTLLTHDISSNKGVKPLPIVLRNTDNNIMTPFYGDPDAKPFRFACQNEWQVINAVGEKYLAIVNALNDRRKSKNHLPFFNGFNAAFSMDTGYGDSWDVSTFINPKMVEHLSDSTIIDTFRQPLGFVFYDFVGVHSLSLYFDPDPVFKGDELARHLVWHNFRDVYFTY